jgi:predicted O-methyltransferase YrrM/DNA-binding transcriptional regulator YiaG
LRLCILIFISDSNRKLLTALPSSPVKEIFQTISYARHLVKAGNAHDIHSPFAYDLYVNIICDETPFYSYDNIEAIRSQMLLSKEKIEVHDLGAGKQKVRKWESEKVRNDSDEYDTPAHFLPCSLSRIARHSVKPKKYGQLLFRLVNHFQPASILEIGTSLGITILYLATPNKKSKVITLEGCPNTAAVAENNFRKTGVNNIKLMVGDFDETIPTALKELPRLDFVYFDGNHRKEPTLRYFRQCLFNHHQNSVFVFDDIYWSREMAEAWEEIKKEPTVTMTIDLYSFGIVFFKKELQKQNYRLRF